MRGTIATTCTWLRKLLSRSPNQSTSAAGDHVQQTGGAVGVDHRSQVHDHRGEVWVTLTAAVLPLVLVHPEVADPVEAPGAVEHEVTGQRGC